MLSALIRNFSTLLIFLTFIFFSSYGYSSELSHSKIKGKKEMNNICEFDEDIDKFNNYFDELKKLIKAEKLISTLKNNFTTLKYGENVTDFVYSKTEKALLFGFSKKCLVKDNVNVEWKIAIITKLNYDIIFSQTYMLYDTDTFKNKKRSFSFERIHGSNDLYSKLIQNEIKGNLKINEIDDYMKKLGGVKISESKNKIRYLYKIDPLKDTASRLALWDFSKIIEIEFGPDGFVINVKVSYSM